METRRYVSGLCVVRVFHAKGNLKVVGIWLTKYICSPVLQHLNGSVLQLYAGRVARIYGET
jgi:hypothetical protein